MPAPSRGFLVTGSQGRLGRLLRCAWRHAPPCGGPRPLWQSRHAPADLVWSPGASLTDAPACDTVIALWGVTGGSAANLSVNTDLAFHSLRLARATGASRVLHLSSAAIYGPGTGHQEAQPPAPVTPYGHAKMTMEDTIRHWQDGPIRHCRLRLANVVGAESLAAALQPPGRPVTLDRFADGRGPRRSYIAPGDLARVLAGLAALPLQWLPSVLNVTAPCPIGMEDLARAAGCPVTWHTAPHSAVPEVSLDGARLAALLPGAVQCQTPDRMIADLRRCQA